ncbi:GDP-mannose mannosyl hydrolase [Glaciecola sp. 2405UD65-10]|uniref:GDP-mannose mannosyl hydrolase n=1 Tax=Glaciecola sp. 2405UD65-10 TaxID=3397244 RepID=UPI003B5BCA41
MLNKDMFEMVVASTPLVSIDLLVRDAKGRILLGKRVNRPAKGSWFVPGGRVLKDETLEQAFIRLLDVELGIGQTKACFKGIYEHFYEENFSEKSFTTHYVVMAYEIMFTAEMSVLPIAQHNDYRWFSATELLNHSDVHIHTKWYFQRDKQADFLFM